ncbi:hypothetical protein SAMN02745121_01150 [Nannocystis exedens]|uniref:Uncharacterized protein n=1 Tax=Nannocystis exedens TaxID=54 RepID=A0A1I1UKV1_9BACT|nr:hypothetical protein [Nannocystis exedens]PCC71606.1 hypothetical protein NAEX_04683 [Nannocystis exedens]SFD68590.1 hypothetical protein SAMN02745121_01150 [Nannocystis exedens]
MDDLDAYGRDYVPQAAAGVADHAIRGGDRYVGQRDLLRAIAVADSGAEADVQLGVDPGTFYCADQLANLIALAGEPAFAGVLTGFIHVPPDRSTGAAAAAATHLLPRRDNLQQCARVVAAALRELSEETSSFADTPALVLTAFGPFAGVVDNPTAAFVGDGDGLAAMVRLAAPELAPVGREPLATGVLHRYAGGGRELLLATAELPLAASPDDALAGRYFDPDTVAATFRRALADIARVQPPRAIVSLGVDSGQVLRPARPAFRVETQTRGFHGATRGRTASDAYQRHLALARLYLRARARGDGPLRFR